MKIEKVVHEIDKIVRWYATDENHTPDELFKEYTRLTGYLWFFADYVAGQKWAYNAAYFTRKIGVIREQSNLVKTGLAVNKAEAEATLANEDQYKIELEREAEAYRAELLLRQGNRVADCMRSKLSYMKKEIEQSTTNE